MSNLNIEKTIKIKNQQARVSSRDVAKIFEKTHNKVLRDIRELNVPEDFNVSNFGQVEYKDKKGEKRPEYLITRDGFTVLVMGYTGEKAMKFKLAYIEAFNKMEQFIKSRSIARMEYADMTKAIMNAHETPMFYHYTTENDMINRLVTGMTAKQIRVQRCIPDNDKTRDYMTPEEITQIEKLQKYNTILLEQEFDYPSRKAALTVYLGRIKRNMALER